jgi:hypothetical protein
MLSKMGACTRRFGSLVRLPVIGFIAIDGTLPVDVLGPGIAQGVLHGLNLGRQVLELLRCPGELVLDSGNPSKSATTSAWTAPSANGSSSITPPGPPPTPRRKTPPRPPSRERQFARTPAQQPPLSVVSVSAFQRFRSSPSGRWSVVRSPWSVVPSPLSQPHLSSVARTRHPGSRKLRWSC